MNLAWKGVVHFWKYVKCTHHLCLTIHPNPDDKSNSLQQYNDTTWADDLKTRLSHSGSILFWKHFPVSWNSKKQQNITLSSTEAELVQENQWIKFLVEELWNEKIEPASFHIDNKGLLEKIKKFGSNSKTKHLDIKMKWICEFKKKNEISVILIPCEDMIADTLTKPSNADSLTPGKKRWDLHGGSLKYPCLIPSLSTSVSLLYPNCICVSIYFNILPSNTINF
ncbi:hypothetical protein VP01_6501g1 [Puccinia sorghi]|uniref:Uncharacterized protein n=1 Tax=Puccinia sorghi TaxID=27349 RepID=A0A0L6UFH9_9BASI|nr:hypothetical protein VP01_6501g1 [Puccinia sorghi]